MLNCVDSGGLDEEEEEGPQGAEEASGGQGEGSTGRAARGSQADPCEGRREIHRHFASRSVSVFETRTFHPEIDWRFEISLRW